MFEITHSERLITIVLTWLHYFLLHTLGSLCEQEVNVDANKDKATAESLIIVSLNVTGHRVSAINSEVLCAENMWQLVEEHLTEGSTETERQQNGHHEQAIVLIEHCNYPNSHVKDQSSNDEQNSGSDNSLN